MKTIQFGWQACSKCGGLFYTDRTPVPTCEAGGQHETSGNTNRGVMNVPATWTDNFPDSEEPNWRFCANCHGLFRILGDADAVDHGVCIPCGYGINSARDRPREFPVCFGVHRRIARCSGSSFGLLRMFQLWKLVP